MSKKINIGLSGSSGRVGQSLSQMIKQDKDLDLVCTSNKKISPATWNFEKVDVVLDFSLPEAFDLILEKALKNKKPFVSGTTGLSEKQKENLKISSNDIPIFYSENMSYGVWQIQMWLKNLFFNPDLKIEFIESHHKNKKDKPSGTALNLKSHLPALYQENINIISQRKDDEVGIHSLKFFNQEESVLIEHKAFSRDLFSKGALKALKWLVFKKPGLYSLNDLYYK